MRAEGLGPLFANALNESIPRIVGVEGEAAATRSNHLEKVALLRPRVGKDNISDFATNLIKHYLVDYTEKFAKQFLDPASCREVGVRRIRFNFDTQTWVTEVRYLPMFNDDYVLLTPANLLVHDETWINYSDMVRRYPQIVAAVDDDILRDQVNRYFESSLGKNPSAKVEAAARQRTFMRFPSLLDVYIALKEADESGASSISEEELALLREIFVGSLSELVKAFWSTPEMQQRPRLTSIAEAKYRVLVFKKWVEDKDGYLELNRANGLASEKEVQRLIFLTLQASEFDVNREVNNGRGPVDFKVSRGRDATLIEIKLASNSHLERNLEKQVDIYKKANETVQAVTVIICYTAAEQDKVKRVLTRLELPVLDEIVAINARKDDKPSGSKA